MGLPSYIQPNTEELFDKSPESIQDIVADGKVDGATITLAEKYKIPVGKQGMLADVITYILIGALQPDDVVQALQELVEVSGEDALHIAEDLEHSILEEARISLFKKPGKEPVAKLEYQGEKSADALRKEILDTTKRESGITKDQSTPTPEQKKTSIIRPGSRMQLIEQLQVLETIPDDAEIGDRLAHIREQIGKLKKQEEDNSLNSNIALKSFMFGEKGKEVAETVVKPATYSVAPVRYNVDPYKEVVE